MKSEEQLKKEIEEIKQLYEQLRELEKKEELSKENLEKFRRRTQTKLNLNTYVTPSTLYEIMKCLRSRLCELRGE